MTDQAAPWPCPECGGEREHSFDCPFLVRLVTPMVEFMELLDRLCGDGGDNDSEGSI